MHSYYEIFESTGWLQLNLPNSMTLNYPHLNSLDYYIWNELEHVVYKNQINLFHSLELQQQKIKYVWPLTWQDNFQLAIDQRKDYFKPQLMEQGPFYTLILRK